MAYTIKEIYEELEDRLDPQEYELSLAEDEVNVYKNNAAATVYFDNPAGRPQGIAIDFKVGQKRTHGYYELQSTDFDEITQDIEDTLSGNANDPFERMEESTRVKASLKYLRECGYMVTKKH